MNVKLREKKLNDASISLYLDIYFNGKRKYEFLDIHLSNKREFSKQDKQKRELAEKIRIKRENDLRLKDIEPIDKKNKNIDYFDFVKKIEKGKNAANTCESLLFNIRKFIKKETTLPFYVITDQWIINFQKYLLERISNTTIVRYIEFLNKSLKLAVQKRIISHNPYDEIPKRLRIKEKREHNRTFLTIDEINLLAKAKTRIKPQFRQIFLLSCFTGLRWGDVSELKWDDIKKMTIDNKEQHVITFRQNKTSRVEYLPLSAQAIKILEEIKEKKLTKYIFQDVYDPETDLKRTRARRINESLKIWAKNAGLKKNLHFHMSRHTFATLALTYGTDLYTVSKLLGHSNIATTTIYAKIIDKKRSDAVSKLPVIV